MNLRSVPGDLPLRRHARLMPGGRWINADLYSSAAVAAALLLSLLVPLLEPVRIVLGLLMGLYVPGYLVMCLLIGPERLPRLERVGLSLVMSIAIVIGSAFFMAPANFPLTAPHLMEVLLSETIILSASNWVVRRKQNIRISGFEWIDQVDRRIVLYLATIAAIIAVTGIVVAHTLGMQSVAFSITSPTGQLSGFPYQIAEGQAFPMRLSVYNPDHHAKTFTLDEYANHVLMMKEPVVVSAQSRWTQKILLPDAPVIASMHVDFRLVNGKGGGGRQLWISYQVIR